MIRDPALLTRLSRYLPADLLRQPDADGLTEIIRQLNALEKSLTSFLPLYVSEDESMLTHTGGQLRPGTFLFADVSGFTALSELLQQHGGPEGAETLTLIINAYFSTMLEILAKSDGQLLKFAGDALLAFFPATNREDAIKAVRTGVRMQRAMAQFQPLRTRELTDLLGPDHGCSLTMSIGISRGQLFEAIVGNNVQRDHIIQGDVPDRAMRAEAVGEPDTVIVDRTVSDDIAAVFALAERDDGYFTVVDNLGNQLDDYEFRILNRRRTRTSAIFDRDADQLREHLQLQLERVEQIAPFVAPAVLHALIHSQSQRRLDSENRLVVTLFLSVSGFAQLLAEQGSDQLERVVALLDRYYTSVQHIITTHGGNITRTDPYELGIKLLITFGAPVAHPDDPQRAVEAALVLRDQLETLNQRLRGDFPRETSETLTQRIGITLGPVFAGEVGWRARREYTVMGDDVNLAARLMSRAAADQILVSSRMHKRVKMLFEMDAAEMLVLKGKREPIQAYSVSGRIETSRNIPNVSEIPFVGHDGLRDRLAAALDDARQQQQIIALTGEAGSGKTRLAHEIYQVAARGDFRVAWATCTLRSNRKTTWAALISQLIGADLTDNRTRRDHLNAHLQSLDLAHLSPAFIELLFDPHQPTERERLQAIAAPPPQRTASTQTDELDTLYLRNLRQRYQPKTARPSEKESPGSSGVFALAQQQLSTSTKDDTQPKSSLIWGQLERRVSLQEAIVTYMQRFTQQYPTLLVIDDLHHESGQALPLLNRLLGETATMPLFILATADLQADLPASFARLTVGDLTAAETEQLARSILNVPSLGERLRDLVWTRTNGRPVFIEALLYFLIDHHQIDRGESHAELKPGANTDGLPDDVVELVMSRVDQLRPEAQAVLRAGAVMGAGFSEDALMTVAVVSDRADLSKILHDLTRAELIEPGPDGLFQFRYGMMQRAIYDTLPRALRQKLHRTAADYLTQQPDWEREPLLVAHHWIRGGRLTRALELFTTLAEKAESEHELEQALEFCNHALELNPSDRDLQQQLERLLTQLQRA